MIQVDAPATVLFSDFEQLCKDVTAEFYKQELMNLYFRAMAYLAMTAEKVEELFGMERLPDPFHSTWDPLGPSADIAVESPG